MEKNKKIITLKRAVFVLILVAMFVAGYLFSLIPIGVRSNSNLYGNDSYLQSNFRKQNDYELVKLFSAGFNLHVYFNTFSHNAPDVYLDRFMWMIIYEQNAIAVMQRGNNGDNILNVTFDELRTFEKMLSAMLETCYKIKHSIPCIDDKYDKEALLELYDYQLMYNLMNDLYFVSGNPEKMEEKGIVGDGPWSEEAKAKIHLDNFRSEEFINNYLNPLLENASIRYPSLSI